MQVGIDILSELVQRKCQAARRAIYYSNRGYNIFSYMGGLYAEKGETVISCN